jgi:hypothetical protein
MEISQAFHVEGELEPTKPPSTAEEYLQQVRWEANRLEDVVVAPDKEREETRAPVHGVRDFPRIPSIPPGMRPSKEWQEDLLFSFEETRTQWEVSFQQTTESFGVTFALELLPPYRSPLYYANLTLCR